MDHDSINKVSRRYCSYNGCTSDRLTTNDGAITFFSFPKDTERCSKWITNSGREEFRYLTPNELKGKKICELHFAPCMFSNKFRTNLKKSAFPMNWKNSTPELIQIDDDDEDDYNDHNATENVETLIVNGVEVQELSDDETESEQPTLNSNVLASSTTNNPTTKDSSTEVNEQSLQEASSAETVSNNTTLEPEIQSQNTSAVTSSTSPSEEITKDSTDKSPSKSNPTPSDKSKFHNLPSQTPQGEFYYQQCLTLAESNHSYPEPPDVGEMPLFVQQNSVASIADETARSEGSEPAPKKRKVDQEVDLTAQMKDAMKYLKDITELLTTSDDEFELFGKSVTLQLKKMSLCTALAVQAKIQQLLSHYRIKDIKNKAPSDLNKGKLKSHRVNGDRTEEENPNSPQVSCQQRDGEVEVNGVENVEEEEENVNSYSPQLSLDCTSETDKEVDLNEN